MSTPAATTTPDERVISAAAGMDAVTLRVGDLERMARYYGDAFALTPIEERTRGREVHRVLGRGGTPMVRLVLTPDLPAWSPRSAGLFHTAFLFDDASSLAATVLRAAQTAGSQFTGSSDHGVSEAFCFTDPEGNGVELYTDRPRSAWVLQRGQIMMDTAWLDPNRYLQQHLTEDAWDAAPALAGKVGHVHLQVGDLAVAERFYGDVIGFQTTLREYPGALFASAGDYHHHVAMNVWNSQGAGPRAASLGLGDVAVTVPAREDLDQLVTRMREAGVDHRDEGASVVSNDPWGTQVTVSVAGGSVDGVLSR